MGFNSPPTIIYIVAKVVNDVEWGKVGITSHSRRIQTWTGQGWLIYAQWDRLDPPIPKLAERHALDAIRLDTMRLSRLFMPYGGHTETFEGRHLDTVENLLINFLEAAK